MNAPIVSSAWLLLTCAAAWDLSRPTKCCASTPPAISTSTTTETANVVEMTRTVDLDLRGPVADHRDTIDDKRMRRSNLSTSNYTIRCSLININIININIKMFTCLAAGSVILRLKRLRCCWKFLPPQFFEENCGLGCLRLRIDSSAWRISLVYKPTVGRNRPTLVAIDLEKQSDWLAIIMLTLVT